MSHHCLEVLMGICGHAMGLLFQRLGQVSISFIEPVDICEACILFVSLQGHFHSVLSHPFQLLHAGHVVDRKAHLHEV